MDESIIFYEKALESVEKYRPFFRTDATQVYHIYYNLAQIVEFYGVEQINKDQSPLAPFNGVVCFLLYPNVLILIKIYSNFLKVKLKREAHHLSLTTINIFDLKQRKCMKTILAKRN